jgi:hypothetical protein
MPDNASAGATPVAGGATPPQTPAQPAPGPPTARSDPRRATTTRSGTRGKRALDGRRRPSAAEAERDEARERARGARERVPVRAREGARPGEEGRRAEVAHALPGDASGVPRSGRRSRLAGVSATLLDLAPGPTSSRALKVNDEGDVEGLATAVEAFKKAMPDLFKPAAPAPAGRLRRRAPRAAGDGRRDMNTLIRRAAGAPSPNRPSDRSASDGRGWELPTRGRTSVTTYNSLISRTDAAALIPEEVSREIIAGLPAASARRPRSAGSRWAAPSSACPRCRPCRRPTGSTRAARTRAQADVRGQLGEQVPRRPRARGHRPGPEAVLDDSDYDIWAEARSRGSSRRSAPRSTPPAS